MSYTLKDGLLIRDLDGAVIPIEPLNRDYVEYLAWKAAGNTPVETPPVVQVPGSVFAWKARAALKQAGKFDAAQAAVAASGDVRIQEAFEYAPEWHRNSPGVIAMGTAIGLDSQQLDELFIAAREIVV